LVSLKLHRIILCNVTIPAFTNNYDKTEDIKPGKVTAEALFVSCLLGRRNDLEGNDSSTCIELSNVVACES
jgi:hypothetical protein